MAAPGNAVSTSGRHPLEVMGNKAEDAIRKVLADYSRTADKKQDHKGREKFIRTLLLTLSRSLPGVNIVIQNTAASQHQTFQGMASCKEIEYPAGGVKYRVWVFCGPGKLIRYGDGGVLNWVFAGSYEENGNVVLFGEKEKAQYEKWWRDVIPPGMDPWEHYAQHGRDEGRGWPSAANKIEYLRLYPGVRKAGVCAYEHYVAHGRLEGRSWSLAP